MVASPASQKPRFRQDLVAEPVEDGASRFIDVADPDTGNLFRFYEVEYSLACAMDGARDVAGIVQWAKEELGLATSPKEVQLVISTLHDLGYLEGGAAAAAAAAPAHVEQPAAAVVPAGVKPAAKPAVNKWDAPTQMGDADDYLEPGVVAAKPAAVKHAPAEDVELGNAGTTPAKVEVELPRAPELELGAPGVTAAASSKSAPAPKVSDVALGTAGRSEVSTDLAMDVSAADVKEAVRQSQVMKAVDVPKELLESVEPTVTTSPEPKKPEPKVEAKKPEPKVEAKKPEPKVEAKKPEPKAEPKKPEPKVEKRPAVAAKEPPKEEKRPVVPPAPKSGASPVLIAFLVLAVLGAGAFFAYKYVFKKKDAGTQATVTPPVQPKPPEPPPPPPVESQKLATEQPEPVELKATVAGQLETIVANDTAVKAGDPVAMLAGHKPIETEIAAIQKDIDSRVKPELDKATKDHDTARIADRQKSLNDKQAKLDAKKADLGKLQIKAPADGKVTAVAKANTKIAANDVVAKLAKAPVLIATFKTASGVTPQSRVLLAVKGGDQKVSCTVVTADASGVKVECPQGGATEGAEVTFVGPDTSAPAQGSAEIDMNDEGSAAKAPEAGSAAPGSAAATPPAPPADKPATPPAPPPAPKAPAKAAPKAPAHAAPKTPAKPADAPADKPAEPPADKPADKPAEPAPAPAPAGGDTLK